MGEERPGKASPTPRGAHPYRKGGVPRPWGAHPYRKGGSVSVGAPPYKKGSSGCGGGCSSVREGLPTHPLGLLAPNPPGYRLKAAPAAAPGEGSGTAAAVRSSLAA